jgi:D-serine deaminase-like pyridoxal phosphate-dependent protein
MTIADMPFEAFREILDRQGIGTPQPIVDLDALEANLIGMANGISDSGCDLRPHFKTHRSVEIASRQIELGAKGLTCATVSEAEALADHGFEDIFIAYPLWAGGATGRRLRELQEKANLRIGIDSIDSVDSLAAAMKGNRVIEVSVEIDPGFHRSGVPPHEALQVARSAERHGFVVAGVFTYPGHAYNAPSAVESAAKDEQRALTEAGEALTEGGIRPTVLSGGSTPTALLSAGGVVNEVRPGVYVFNDRQQVALKTCRESDVALVVLATVVSISVPGSIVVDAGSKALSSDRLPWMDGFGAIYGAPDLIAHSLSEHHGIIESTDDSQRPEVGEIVAIVPNHVCNAVNLFDDLLVLGGGEEFERWPVLARSGPS